MNLISKIFRLTAVVMLIGLGGRLAAAQQSTDVRVFAYDGTLLCGMGHEISLKEGQIQLEKLGAAVISAEKRKLPVFIPQYCGALTGNVNTYVISEQDWAKIRHNSQGTAAFAQWVFDKPTVEVFKYDGTLQCGRGTEIPLTTMESELKNAGIDVVSKPRKDHDGLMHIQMCGASTGSINVFSIKSNAFEAARKLGFEFFVSRNTIAEMTGAKQRMRPLEGMPMPWPFPW